MRVHNITKTCTVKPIKVYTEKVRKQHKKDNLDIQTVSWFTWTCAIVAVHGLREVSGTVSSLWYSYLEVTFTIMELFAISTRVRT